MYSPTSLTRQNISPPSFDPIEFQIDQFFGGVEGDIKSLLWCIKKALRSHRNIECREEPFAFGDYGDDPAELWGWSIVDLRAPHNRSTSFVVSAIQRGDVRLYTFETDDGVLSDIQLAGNEKTIFDFLVVSVLRGLS